MENIIFRQPRRIILAVFGFLLLSVPSYGSGQGAITLDTANSEAAQQFAKRLSGLSDETTVAITSLGSHSLRLSDYIITELTKGLIDTPDILIVDRRSLDRAREEINFNMSSEIDEATAQRIGGFVGAQYVIFGTLSELGKDYYINIRVLQVVTGRIQAIYSKRVKKRSVETVAPPPKPEKSPKPEKPPKPPKEPSRIVANAYRNGFYFLGGYIELGDDGLIGGGGVALTQIGVNWSPFPFTVIGFEARFGALINPSYAYTSEFSVFDGSFFIPPFFFIGLGEYFRGSGVFSLGLVIPFTQNVKLFGDGLIELGYFGVLKGFLGDSVTPAFDVGLSCFWESWFPAGFNIKYRGTWYADHYTHAIGIDVILGLGGEAWKTW